MKRITSRLDNVSPRRILHILRRRLISLYSRSLAGSKEPEINDELRRRFAVYRTPNLKGVSPDAFARHLKSQIGVVDAKIEGYPDDEISMQRDLSIEFHWGHDHDFGDFALKGRTGDGYIRKLATFIDLFPVSLEDFRNSYVFDIGCWTGGTTLLLATVAKRVHAIEEVRKYAAMASYLSRAFGVDDRVTAEARSLYDCDSQEFYDRFDIVFFPGVIYHLSDPVLGLRILYNSLKVGGTILIESAGINVKRPLCRFDGSLIHDHGTRERRGRNGWNWFVPSPSALHRMMKEAGFDDIQTHFHYEYDRIYAYGKKVAQVGICRAGLSVPDIR